MSKPIKITAKTFKKAINALKKHSVTQYPDVVVFFGYCERCKKVHSNLDSKIRCFKKFYENKS